MKLAINFAVAGAAACLIFGRGSRAAVTSMRGQIREALLTAESEKVHSSCADAKDLYLVTYNSESIPNSTYQDFLSKIDGSPGYSINIVAFGEGQELGGSSSSDPLQKENTRSWIWRWRKYVATLEELLERRGGKNFVVLLFDSTDVLFNSRVSVKDIVTRFQDFGTDIVFSGQIYCCNPWKYRQSVLGAFQSAYAASPAPSAFKYLNAGSYIGCAKSIVAISHEIGIMNKEYVLRDAYTSAAYIPAGTATPTHTQYDPKLVDDDEFQWGLWYANEWSQGPKRRATIDYDQSLFTTTTSMRVTFHDNKSFDVWTPKSFSNMRSNSPTDADEIALGKSLGECQYSWAEDKGEWHLQDSSIKPLVFHFAGHDWLCRCRILEKIETLDQEASSLSKKNSPLALSSEECEGAWGKWADKIQTALQKQNLLDSTTDLRVSLQNTAPQVANDTSMY